MSASWSFSRDYSVGQAIGMTSHAPPVGRMGFVTWPAFGRQRGALALPASDAGDEADVVGAACAVARNAAPSRAEAGVGRSTAESSYDI
jgi:hypothetical protein